MKKRIFRSLLVTLVVLLTAIFLYINYLAHGITGYAAKNLASGIFVAGRTQESIEKEDINFFPVRYSKNSVDFENKEVTSRLLLWKSKAVYNEGLGCTLVNDFSEEAVRKLDYPPVLLPQINPDTIPWPAGDKVSDTIPSGINMQKINETLDQVFKDTLKYKGTFAVTIVYKDQIVAERYRSDFNPSTRFLSWSMAKSFTNAMVGLLVKERKVDINSPINRKEWAEDSRKNITLNNLLQMNSGLEFNEAYSKVKLTDATTMLLKHGDMGDYAASKKLLVKPDSIWSYSSGSSNIVQDYLRSVIGNDEEYLSFPRKSLFNRTGMLSVIWEPDASGTFVGSSYLYATARDYARFGLLYLHNGNWLGEQILPEGWVSYTSSPAKGSNGEYGALFWLNRSDVFKGVPADLFYCDGYEGQYIFIIPSKQLVVVRTGCSPNDSFDQQSFLKEIVDSID
jgi:CubicO group peptidase (beta-lactamase class C family)